MTTVKAATKFEEYTRTNGFKRLIEEHKSLGTRGVWEIRGEDSNCDMGGSHHMPLLEVVSGRLQDVIEYGVHLQRFWTWGSGGEFRKREEKVKDIPLGYKHIDGVRQKKQEEINQLEARIRELNAEMKAL